MDAAKVLLAATALWLFSGAAVTAQQGRVHTMDRYPAEEASTGYAAETDQALPGAYQLYLQTPQSLGGVWGWGPRRTEISRISFAADSHAKASGYSRQRDCLDCHEGLERNLHSARTSVTCRQCHHDEPVAGVFHYFSVMNPIRRHAYVCAKCHQGATANFAAYVVHETNPLASVTREQFPALFYVTWFMVILTGGVFLFFIPYSALWGVRELIAKMKGEQDHGNA